MRYRHCCMLALAALAGCASVGTREQPDLAIENVSVVDVATGEVNSGRTVVIRDSTIVEVTDRRVAAKRLIDGSGKFLIPGLWDAHVHLSFTPDETLPMFVAAGVTSVRDLGSRLEDTRRQRARIARGELVGPTIFTAGPVLESEAWMNAAYQIAPKGDSIWYFAPRVIATRANVAHVVDSLKALGVDLIKARNVWGDDFIAVADAAERAGMLFAAHNPNRVNMAVAARHGLDSFEHSESVMGDFDTMSVASRAAMFQEVAKTGAWVTPTLMADIGLIVSSDSVLEMHLADTVGRMDPRNRTLPPAMRVLWRKALDARRKYGAEPPETYRKIARDTRAMHAAGIRMLAGTDVGSIPLVYPGSSVHEELALLVRDGGLTPLEALQTATINPARFFRIANRVGLIAPGHRADLVLLDANPLMDIGNVRRVRGVVLRGVHRPGLGTPGM